MSDFSRVRVAAVVAAVAVTAAIVFAIGAFLNGLVALPVSRDSAWWVLGFSHGLLLALILRGLSRRSRRLRRVMRRRAAASGRWRP